MTTNFFYYLMYFNIKCKDRLNIKDFRFDNEAVFDGWKIFDFYFFGTDFKDYPEYNGPETF